MAQNLGNFIDIKCIKEHKWETRWSLREAEQLDKLKHTIYFLTSYFCMSRVPNLQRNLI